MEAARRLLRAAVGALPAGEIADVIDQLGKQIFERLVHVVVLKENAAHAAASTKAASSIAQRLVDADSAPKSHALEICKLSSQSAGTINPRKRTNMLQGRHGAK